jgi:hypothetical protein
VKRAFQTLLAYVGNVAKKPDEEKFRKIRLSNATFQVMLQNLEHVVVNLLSNVRSIILIPDFTGEGWKSAWRHRVP